MMSLESPASVPRLSVFAVRDEGRPGSCEALRGLFAPLVPSSNRNLRIDRDTTFPECIDLVLGPSGLKPNLATELDDLRRAVARLIFSRGHLGRRHSATGCEPTLHRNRRRGGRGGGGQWARGETNVVQRERRNPERSGGQLSPLTPPHKLSSVKVPTLTRWCPNR